jgi:hypothetical protein
MKDLGFGLGLRSDHYDTILTELPPIGFFEALTEIYLVPGGKALHYLNRVREKYPLVLHGVSLSIGSTQPINRDYLKALRTLMQRIQHPIERSAKQPFRCIWYAPN